MRHSNLLSPLEVTMTAILLATQARANPTFTAVTPIFGQVVVMRYPSQFRMVNEETNGANNLQESVKAGETVDSPTRDSRPATAIDPTDSIELKALPIDRRLAFLPPDSDDNNDRNGN